MKKIIIIITALIEVGTLQTWFVCQGFTDIFHYSSVNLAYQLDTYINPFKGIPLWIVRLFHNKLVQIPINFLRFYLQFWDIRFGSNWFSLIGYFGIFAGFYYLISEKKKKVYHWLALIMLLVLPCIEILLSPQLPIIIKSVYLWIPFIIFSLYGIYQFMTHGERKKRSYVVAALLILSLLWIFFLPHAFSRYCIPFVYHKLKR